VSRLILFDLDGTLLQPRDPLHSRAFSEVLADVCGFRDDIDWTGTSGMVDRAILAELFQRAGMSAADARAALTRACRQMGASYMRGPLDGPPEDRTMPGARALVERLHSLNVPMGLLTGNISDIAWGRVDECGLRSYFVSGAFGDEAMRRSTLVRRAIHRCGQAMSTTIDPTEVIVVGDTPRDVRAAHLAGARAVAVATGEFTADELQRQRPVAVLADLTDTDSVTRLLTSC
jgi:phosphoglycolate phosphatase-like HAD superfamily hydrolase